MKLGNIIGALSPGLSMTGLFGNNAQHTAGDMLGMMSPLLMLLMHKKKKDGAAADGSGAPNPAMMNPQQAQMLMQSPLFRGMGGQGQLPPLPGMSAPGLYGR